MDRDGGSGAAHAGSGQPLSPLESTAAVTREAVRILVHLVRHGRPRRTGRRVALEYDGGYWADMLARKPWRQSASLSEFLVPRDRATRVAKVDGRLTRIANEDYYRYRTRMLQRVLVEHARDAQTLVELGCGYGANLFSLVELNRWRSIVGFDVSASAIHAAREIGSYFACGAGLEFDRLDLLDRAAPGFARLRGATAFSYYCFEQLKRDTGTVIDNLIDAGVSRVIHIEPTPELWSPVNPVDLVSRLHTWSQDYQDNLLATLRQREHSGQVKLLQVHRLRYAPSVRHDPTLVCWEPARR